MLAACDGQLKNFNLRWYPEPALTVVMALTAALVLSLTAVPAAVAPELSSTGAPEAVELPQPVHPAGEESLESRIGGHWLLYVGTDDGNLQVSRDGGQTWKNVADKVSDIDQLAFLFRLEQELTSLLVLVAATIVGFYLRDLKAIFIYIQEFWSIAYPSVCALFLAGFFYRRATARGAATPW